MLELAAKLDDVAFGQFNGRFYFRLSFTDKTFYVAPAQIYHDSCPALAGIATDRINAGHRFQFGDLVQRQHASVTHANREVSQFIEILTGVLVHSHDDVEATIAFDDGTDRLTAEGCRNG